jgi:membrane-bound lytic murein transglycosylase B
VTTPPGPTLALSHPDPGLLASARARLRAATTALAAAQRARTDAVARAAALQERGVALRGRIDQLGARERALARQLQDARERLRRLALADYVTGGESSAVDFLLRARDPSDLTRRRQLVATVGSARTKAVRAFTAARRAASDELARVVAELDRVSSEAVGAAAQVERADAQVAQRTVELDEARRRLRLATAVSPAAGTDIPGLLLDAYRAAAATLAKEDPACAVTWSAIAAVGKVESNHGRVGDSKLTVAGEVTPPILGLPLDGTAGTALVPDTDRGRLDGDPVVDRAVGPMQIIPSTWMSVGRDGNGDGIADPSNVFDAALGAATYLCRAAPDGMRTDADLASAFFSYNHAAAYSAEVLLWVHAYASQHVPPGPIVT